MFSQIARWFLYVLNDHKFYIEFFVKRGRTTKTLKKIANGGYITPDAKRRKFGTTVFVGVNLPMTDFQA